VVNDQSADPSSTPLRSITKGQLIGSIVGFVLLSVITAIVLGPRESGGWMLLIYLVGWFLGGTIGGLWELQRERRMALAGQFVKRQAAALLAVLPIFAAALVGQWYYGATGFWIGLVAGLALVIAGAAMLQRARLGRGS
jgi:hypothetical protein